MEIVIRPRVQKYINNSGEKERLVKHLKKLSEDHYNSRSGVDKKKLKGKKHVMYRLRVGEHRFEYFVEEEKIWVDEAFKRGRGYR
ncbi:MAG: type II toxin-antitoxin system RelE/ParE family toxin [Thermoplasmatota archaeon]